MKYELVCSIGGGAFSTVAKARCSETGRIVAIKRFNNTDDNDGKTRWEVKILRQLKDELYIVKLIEAIRHHGHRCLVFEYVGSSVADVLQRDQQHGVSPDQLQRMIFSMLQAVHACHRHGIMHRRVKPENLLVANDGTLRLCDFTLARPRSDEGAPTDYIEARWYRSPELLLDSAVKDQMPSDIFGAGCVMAELIDGVPLLPGTCEMDQIYRVSELLGPFTARQQATFKRRFPGNKLPPPRGPSAPSLDRRYGAKDLSEAGLSLLKGLLKIDPDERLTAEQALQHPYFDGLRDGTSVVSTEDIRASDPAP